MKKDIFDFPLWINESALSIVIKALQTLEKTRNAYGHSFYISFVTTHVDVTISDSLLKQYPEIMTIVLEHQFEAIKTTKIGLEVTLYFNGIPETLFIPWHSIVAFNDKLSKVQLLFKPNNEKKKKLEKDNKTKKTPSNIIIFPKK